MILPRFYPILDTGLCARRGLNIVTGAEAILAGGAKILQLRHKTHFSRDVFSQAQHIQSLCAAAGALFVINDRADMALLLDSDLHVGQDDLPPAAARRLIGPERLLGFSTHNEAQLCAALEEPVDYVALGPIFGTVSKLNPDPLVGLNELQRLRALTVKPLVAIGGITRSNASQTIEAGADSVAVIADLIPDECTPESLRARVEEWVSFLKLPGRSHHVS
jgi:thiamine-phosphate pyrophosphorylase